MTNCGGHKKAGHGYGKKHGGCGCSKKSNDCFKVIRTQQCNECYDLVTLKFLAGACLIVNCTIWEKVNCCIDEGGTPSGLIGSHIYTMFGPKTGAVANIAVNVCENLLCALFKVDNTDDAIKYLNEEVGLLCDHEVRNCLCKLLGLLELYRDAVEGLVECDQPV